MIRVIAEDRNIKLVFQRLIGRHYGINARQFSCVMANNGITGAIELLIDTCKNPRMEKVMLVADEAGFERKKFAEAMKDEHVRSKACLVLVPDSIEQWVSSVNNIPLPKKRDLPSLIQGSSLVETLEQEEIVKNFLSFLDCNPCSNPLF